MGRQKPRHIIEGAIKAARGMFRNDGAEGETVHLLCDELTRLLPLGDVVDDWAKLKREIGNVRAIVVYGRDLLHEAELHKKASDEWAKIAVDAQMRAGGADPEMVEELRALHAQLYPANTIEGLRKLADTVATDERSPATFEKFEGVRAVPPAVDSAPAKPDVLDERLRRFTLEDFEGSLESHAWFSVHEGKELLRRLGTPPHLVIELVRDHLIPIVEMLDEASDPSEDLYVVLRQVKDALESAEPPGGTYAKKTADECARCGGTGVNEDASGCGAHSVQRPAVEIVDAIDVVRTYLRTAQALAENTLDDDLRAEHRARVDALRVVHDDLERRERSARGRVLPRADGKPTADEAFAELLASTREMLWWRAKGPQAAAAPILRWVHAVRGCGLVDWFVPELLDDELDAIRQRALAATPGKWTTTDGRGKILWSDGAWPVGPYSRSEKQAQADADFIAHAREDVPKLLGAVAALRKLARTTTHGKDAQPADQTTARRIGPDSDRHDPKDGPVLVSIHYFKPTSGKWYCEDENVEWKPDPNHFTGWQPFKDLHRIKEMTAVCMSTPLGFPQSSPGDLSMWKDEPDPSPPSPPLHPDEFGGSDF